MSPPSEVLVTSTCAVISPLPHGSFRSESPRASRLSLTVTTGTVALIRTTKSLMPGVVVLAVTI